MRRAAAGGPLPVPSAAVVGPLRVAPSRPAQLRTTPMAVRNSCAPYLPQRATPPPVTPRASIPVRPPPRSPLSGATVAASRVATPVGPLSPLHRSSLAGAGEVLSRLSASHCPLCSFSMNRAGLNGDQIGIERPTVGCIDPLSLRLPNGPAHDRFTTRPSVPARGHGPRGRPINHATVLWAPPVSLFSPLFFLIFFRALIPFRTS